MTTKKEIVVIGGGVIGLFSAYYLSQEGHHVTVLDMGDFSDGCSYGNAGMIVPSHVIPLAAPGMISQGIKWMFDSKSPFYVRPRFSRSLFSWGMKFYRSANVKHVEKSVPALRDLSLLSKSLYIDLAKACKEMVYQEKGLLMLYQSDKVGEEEIHAGEIAKAAGLEVDFLSKEAVDRLETGTRVNAIGGVHYRSDAHLYPNRLMQFLKTTLKEREVDLISGSKVLQAHVRDGRLRSVDTTMGPFEADEFVFAGGAWTPELTEQIGVKLSLLPGKGYSFTLNDAEKSPIIPSILCEGKVAVTPMAGDLRFGGTMEITHVEDQKINRNRLQGIVNTIGSFYPDLSVEMPENDQTWFGFRPCSPDGLPYIGRTNEVKNAIVASGHAMMGLSLGPATGKLVQQLCNEETPDLDLSLFHPNRKM